MVFHTAGQWSTRPKSSPLWAILLFSNWHKTQYLKMQWLKPTIYYCLQTCGQSGQFCQFGKGGDLSCIFRQLEGWPGAGCSRMALLCSMCLSFSNRLAGACSCDGGRNLRVTKPSCIRGQEETHTCFQASDCMNFAIILSFKTSHTSGPGNYRMTGKGCGYRQVIYWGHR